MANFFMVMGIVFVFVVIVMAIAGISVTVTYEDKTNFDLISEYSDEEMADFLAESLFSKPEEGVAQREYRKAILNWLRAKAE